MDPLRVFIVDDEYECCQVLKLYLQNFDQVRVVGVETNPLLAITHVVNLKPDLIFLDVEMPAVSGFDVISALKKQNFLPILVLTTSHLHYTIRALREEVADYLVKPVNPDELKVCIHKITDKLQRGCYCRLPELSVTETKVMGYLQQGLSSKQIAERLHVSHHTINRHRQALLSKFKAKNTVELLKICMVHSYDQHEKV